MLFVFDEALERDLAQCVEISAARRTAISRILQAYIDGLHVVVIEPKLCRRVEADSHFSFDQRAAAKRARSRFADHSGLVEQVSVFARVVENDLQSPEIREGHWDVPLSWIVQRALSQVVLLAEDLTDTRVLKSAAEDYQRAGRHEGFKIRIEERAGGGGNTARVFEDEALVHQRITLCYVDSDRECPGGPLGETARRVGEIDGQGMFDRVISKGRALENSIPWRLLDTVGSRRGLIPSAQLARVDGVKPSASQFLNTKRGCFGHDITRLGASRCGDYWQEVRIGLNCMVLCCIGSCLAERVGECESCVSPGLGTGLLADVRDWLFERSNDRKRHERYLDSVRADDWMEIGRWVFESGLGLLPQI